MNDLTIFYSWQSDLPNSTNRGLIEDALNAALKELNKDDSIKVIPRVDKDTSGVPGSPNIATAILGKIDKAFLVVSDVSIINNDSPARKTPNPNVLYELGYAVKSIGLDKIILIQNTNFGPPSELPFDLKMQRVITYQCTKEENKSKIKDDLAVKLEVAIKEALKEKEKNAVIKVEKNIKDNFEELLMSQPSPLKVEKELRPIVKQTLELLSTTNIYDYSVYPTSEEYLTRKTKIENILRNICDAFFILGRWADSSQIEIIIRELAKYVSVPDSDETYYPAIKELARYPALLLTYALGLGAVYNTNNYVLNGIFNYRIYDNSSGKSIPLLSLINGATVFGSYSNVVKENRRYFPGSDDLFSIFKDYFEGVSEVVYEDYFDSWEYLISLYYGYWTETNRHSFWIPTGSYMWRTQRRKIWDELYAAFTQNQEKWKYFAAFGITSQKLSEVFVKVNEFINSISNHYN